MTLVPLSVIPKGQKVIISDFHGGHSFKKKLYEMGVFIGSEVEVSTTPGAGFVFIKNGDSKIGIGQGMAHKIFVTPS
ncbi:MAG: FeoA family protein [Candidatus Muiribacteriota bacterium]|jgi:Fe2+ transport system protein FeoA